MSDKVARCGVHGLKFPDQWERYGDVWNAEPPTFLRTRWFELSHCEDLCKGLDCALAKYDSFVTNLPPLRCRVGCVGRA